jgi:hypothetical protein
LLTGLIPNTSYYFAAWSQSGASQYVSSNFLFVTTNYMTTNLWFDLTNTWTFSTANLDGVNWTATNYDDSAWDGSGPGVLWVDARGSVQSGIPEPNTQMSLDTDGYPFTTYYFRTHFNCTNPPAGISLVLTAYVDDGAVFYLNGSELYRLFMPAAPTVINNSTLANGYFCSSGNATCPDLLMFPAPVTKLVAGDNVLAVEVHNYVANSPDITFGMSLAGAVPSVTQPQLGIQYSNQTATLSWARGGYTLQQAGSLAGPWSDVPGPAFSSPFTITNSGANLYFRLRK